MSIWWPRPLAWLVAVAAALEFIAQTADALEAGRLLSAARWVAVTVLVVVSVVFTESVKRVGGR